jgi:hypothetical protein
MVRLTRLGRAGLGLAGVSIVVLFGLLAAAMAQATPMVELDDFGVVPRPAVMRVLLGSESVQRELKLSDEQQKAQEAVLQRATRKMQQARPNPKDRAAFVAARNAALKDVREAFLEAMTPAQRERLDQIQLQAQGPLAFTMTDPGPLVCVGPPLAERLKLTPEQIEKARSISEAANEEIQRAASFPITLDPKDGPPTMETARKLAASPEFLAARKKACQAGRDAMAALVRRIEEALTDTQRAEYHKLLGAPFELATIEGAQPLAREYDVSAVAAALGVPGAQGGGQQSDPTFDTKVANPAYASGPRHPRILFDEAHHNFHTAGGRYKPFAGLMTSDGYVVIPNREKFTPDVLHKGDILVIANALGAEGMGQPGAANPAFSDVECDAVRGWIENGGSLLLIADHAPMGAAARGLARRLGVDMSTGATSDPVNSSGGDTSLVFSRQNHLLGDHPITRGRDDSERLNKIQTFTGTSLKGPEGSTPILKLGDSAVDMPMEAGESKSAAGRAQGLAFPLGKGRVVVMGEAAELSAQTAGGEKFGMNVPGIDNRQLALNIMHWLSGLLEPR